MKLLSLELMVMQCETVDLVNRITEGVIDAAALQNGASTVVDWKTDSVDEEEWSRRKAMYERQVSSYGELLASLTRLPAEVRVERVLSPPTTS